MNDNSIKKGLNFGSKTILSIMFLGFISIATIMYFSNKNFKKVIDNSTKTGTQLMSNLTGSDTKNKGNVFYKSSNSNTDVTSQYSKNGMWNDAGKN